MRRLQDIVLILLVVILGGWALSVFVPDMLGGKAFVWTLTELGNEVFVVVVAVLLGVAAWTLVSSPRSILALAVLVLLLINSPRFLITFQGFGSVVLLVGAVAITWCNAVGARQRRVGHVPTTIIGGVVSFIALSLYFLGCLFSLGQGLGAHTEYVHEVSPDGAWVLRAAEYEEAFGEVTQTVSVGRDLLGLVSLERTIYIGDGDRAAVSWVDGRTLRLNGRAFDIREDPPIEDYQY